jgi:hypothetical protein
VEENSLNFVVIDRTTAWNIFTMKPDEEISIVDREEGYEFRDGIKIDYRKIIFEVDDKSYLLTGAMWDPDQRTRSFAFFSYAEERWSDDETEPVSCPEMVRDVARSW